MSAPFKILQAHHTGVTVRDIDASLAFFVGVLGFTLQYRARRTGSFAEEVTGVPEAEIEVPSTSTISTRPGPSRRARLAPRRLPADDRRRHPRRHPRRLHPRPRRHDAGAHAAAGRLGSRLA